MTYTATYSPDDNKLRLYASTRLPEDVYAEVKAAGFHWAPKQDLFVAPMWTPAREDLLIKLAGEITDDDSSLTERAEERAERFEEYHENRAEDAERARDAVSQLADNIPLGQPILVGHHSEKHARRDAEKIENGMRRAVKMWETAQYWKQRAAGALSHAKYKERPDVRARRIKTLEAALRKVEKSLKESRDFVTQWEKVNTREGVHKKDGSEMTEANWLNVAKQRALMVASYDHVSKCFPLADFPRDPPASQYEGLMSLWSALTDGIINAGQAIEIATRVHQRSIAHWGRWSLHYRNRLEYERAMLGEAGGTVAQQNGPMKGGACQCWASPRGGGWSYIQKVNKVSVTVLDNWHNSNDAGGGRNFTRTIPFDKLRAIMSPLEVDNARQAGELEESTDKTGFYLRTIQPPKEDNVCPDGPACPDPVCVTERERQGIDTGADFKAMKESLRAGIQVVTAPQLFPTPRDVAERMAALADIRPGHKVLEPSAGTGMLLGALGGRMFNEPQIGSVTDGAVMAVELNRALAERLKDEFPKTHVLNADFLECGSHNLGGAFDRIVMNPPFQNADDIRHIMHARSMLKPGGRLVAICANGPRQNEKLRPLADEWEELPSGTFAGTGVSAVLAVYNA